MSNTISGYAARFGDETVIASAFREKLAPGCFTRSLREQPDVLMFLDHDTGRVLGRTTAGSLTLREDRIGLWFSLEADPSTPSGQEALGTVKRGDVHGCSFGFRVRAEEWHDGDDRLPLRVITDVDLFEVTLTAMPAYPTTSASVVSRSSKAEAAMRARGIPLK